MWCRATCTRLHHASIAAYMTPHRVWRQRLAGSSPGYFLGVNTWDRLTRRLDRFQQRLSWLAYPYAVMKKFDDDQAGNAAALMAYYAFVSLFPLLLVFTTILGYVLQDHPHLQQTLLHSALVDFPVIGEELKTPDLAGHWYALAVSLVISFWGAQGVARATQTAFNTVWNVPFIKRPSAWGTILRSVGLLVVMGTSILATGLLSGVGSANNSLGVAARVGAIAASAAINIGGFLLAFRLGTAWEVSVREFRRSAIIAALGWQVLLAGVSLLIAHQIHHQQALYGTFGVVLGLLAWLHLQARLTLYAVEADVVRARRLWPRSVAPPPLTRGDRRAYRAYAATTMRRPDSEIGVDVLFKPQPEDKAMAAMVEEKQA